MTRQPIVDVAHLLTSLPQDPRSLTTAQREEVTALRRERKRQLTEARGQRPSPAPRPPNGANDLEALRHAIRQLDDYLAPLDEGGR